MNLIDRALGEGLLRAIGVMWEHLQLCASRDADCDFQLTLEPAGDRAVIVRARYTSGPGTGETFMVVDRARPLDELTSEAVDVATRAVEAAYKACG